MDGKDLSAMFFMMADRFEISQRERFVALRDIFGKLVDGSWVDRVPEPEDLEPREELKIKKSVPHGKILATKGTSCVCNECKKVAHTVVADVYSEGMSGVDFLACFDPQPPAPLDLLTDEYGNELIDCRLCGAQKSVVFIARNKQVS